jgi:diacylglycerol kinase family enzyme
LEPRAPAAVVTRTVPVLCNCRAGGGRSDAEVEALRRAFAAAGLDAEVLIPRPGDELRKLARQVLEQRPPVLVAAGGDGTVSAVADVVRGTDTALGVVPAGTLNHFARDLGLPLEFDEAARVIAQGRSARVDVGEVNGSVFVNNASLGIYPKIVRERTQQQRRFGPSKRSAMLWATLAALQRSPLVDLRLELEEGVHDCRAPFVFVGNNDYVLEGFDIGKRERLDAGLLNIYTTRRSTVGGLIGLALRALFGRLRQADDFVQSEARTLRVRSRRPRILVAVDGELRLMETPLEFRSRPRSLKVLVA